MAKFCTLASAVRQRLHSGWPFAYSETYDAGPCPHVSCHQLIECSTAFLSRGVMPNSERVFTSEHLRRLQEIFDKVSEELASGMGTQSMRKGRVNSSPNPCSACNMPRPIQLVPPASFWRVAEATASIGVLRAPTARDRLRAEHGLHCTSMAGYWLPGRSSGHALCLVGLMMLARIVEGAVRHNW